MSPRSLAASRLMSSLLVMTLLLVSCSDDVPGPDGPVGPEEPIGPQEPVGPSDESDILGSGVVTSEDRDVSGFDRVVFGGEGRIALLQTGDEKLTIETDDNLLAYIETTVRNGTLEIRTPEDLDIDPTDSILYRLEFADLTAIELGGVGSMDFGTWAAEDATIVLTGVGDVTIELFTGRHLAIDHQGIGAIFITGTVDQQTVTVDGPGDYEAENLQSNTANIEARGSSSLTVWVTEMLEVAVAGSSSVGFYGNPEVTETVTNPGTVTNLGAK